MKFGLYMSTQWPEGADISSEMSNMREQIQVARDNGFSSVWMGQHYLVAPMQMMQTMPLLARLAADGKGRPWHRGHAVVHVEPCGRRRGGSNARLDHRRQFHPRCGDGVSRRGVQHLGVAKGERVGRLEEGISTAPALDGGPGQPRRPLLQDRRVGQQLEAKAPGRSTHLAWRASPRGGGARGTPRRCLDGGADR